jgi:hypothetical protein
VSEKFGWKPVKEIAQEKTKSPLGWIHCLVRLHDGKNNPSYRKDSFHSDRWDIGDAGANKITHYIVLKDIPFIEEEAPGE